MRRRVIILLGLVSLAAPAVAQDSIRTLVRPPVLTARLTHAGTCVPARGTVAFTGRGIPAQRGALRIVAQASGAPVELPVASWSASRITARLPADSRLAPGGSYPVGIRDPQGAWLVRSDRPLVICVATLVAPPAARVTPGVLQPAPAPATPAVAETPKPKPPEEPVGKPVAEEAKTPVTPVAEEPAKPAGAPAEAPPGPAGTRSIATPAIRLTGYAAEPPPRAPFEPRTITTPAIRLTGVRP